MHRNDRLDFGCAGFDALTLEHKTHARGFGDHTLIVACGFDLDDFGAGFKGAGAQFGAAEVHCHEHITGEFTHRIHHSAPGSFIIVGTVDASEIHSGGTHAAHERIIIGGLRGHRHHDAGVAISAAVDVTEGRHGVAFEHEVATVERTPDVVTVTSLEHGRNGLDDGQQPREHLRFGAAKAREAIGRQ